MPHFNRIHCLVIVVILQFVLCGLAGALTIEGQVVDIVTQNPVSDATVEVIGYTNLAPVSTKTTPGSHQFDMTNLAGRFSIDVGDLPGKYTLAISHVSYKSQQVETITDDKLLKVELTPEVWELSEVVVSTGRGTPGRSPGALTNIDRKLVEISYGAQDVPMLTSEVPSATAFSWSGSDVGASEISIRGFSSDRIVATVNGVPVNDPEDHGLYWQDTPDFLSNTYDIQVERGVSSFIAGPAGIGGGMNLVTSDAVSRRELNLTLQTGCFNTQRQTLSYRSGIINKRYNMTGRFSRVTSDGYRDHTSSEMWSYFLAATRFDPNMVTQLQIYGGQEEMDAYWWGVDKNTLEQNRKANYSAWYNEYHEEYFWDPVVEYDGERDFFQQPHFMLHNRWRLTDNLELKQSLFWIKGDGYYEEYKPSRKFAEYNIAPFDVIRDDDDDGDLDTVTVDRTDLIRRKYVDKDQIGWLPRLEWRVTPQTRAELGIERRGYRGDHWGKVIWAQQLPEGTNPQHEWYRWVGDKDYSGSYVNLNHDLTTRIHLNGGVQVRSVTYRVEQEQIGAFNGYKYDLNWLFVNPRIGASMHVDDNTRIYASFAGAGREPVDDQIYDADNPEDIPKVTEFGQHEIDPEYMWDAELGIRRDFDNIKTGINLYGMFFTNEIVKLGFSSELDEEVFDNAPTSRHIGIEIEVKWQEPVPGFTLSGNLSLGQATLGDYEIDHVAGVDDNWNPIIETVNLKGNRIALFPDVIANVRATYSLPQLTFSVHARHVGKQFMDNREDDDAALDPYTVLDATLVMHFIQLDTGGGIDLELRGMNLSDEEYEPYGVVDVEYGTPYYVPAAGRRYLAGITVKL